MGEEAVEDWMMYAKDVWEVEIDLSYSLIFAFTLTRSLIASMPLELLVVLFWFLGLHV